MTTYLVKLPAALAARIQAEPGLLAQVWRETMWSTTTWPA
jgi:hypothetical protein